MTKLVNPQRKYEGAIKPSSIEQDTHELDLFAQRITDIPSNMQMEADYAARIDCQPVYLGFAVKGLADSAEGWLLQKFTYDASNRVLDRAIAYGAWDDRATATYV